MNSNGNDKMRINIKDVFKYLFYLKENLLSTNSNKVLRELQHTELKYIITMAQRLGEEIDMYCCNGLKLNMESYVISR